MKQIRKSIFETNSSSTHSFTISKWSKICKIKFKTVLEGFVYSPYVDMYTGELEKIEIPEDGYLLVREKDIEKLEKFGDGIKKKKYIGHFVDTEDWF